MPRFLALSPALAGIAAVALALAGCGSSDGDGEGPPSDPHTVPDDGIPFGNPDGNCAASAEAGAADTSQPDRVVGDGTPESCTGAAFVEAVAAGGVITFDCGPEPIVIGLDETARVFNDTSPDIVIDGGDRVTLSGKGARRVLYMNTCDESLKWTTDHCNDQDHPRLTVQNIGFVDGNASGLDPDGGGAIFVRGGRFRAHRARFFNNTCDETGPDVGGASIRVLDQSQGLPVFVDQCTFGGKEGYGNACSNGSGLSSIGVSWTVTNSLFSHNRAIGNGANPAQAGTPGGGSGGAIYNDGNTFTLDLCGVDMHDNTANEGGGAIFFVSNDQSGTLRITDSTLVDNPSAGFETLPGIFYIGSGEPILEGSTIE